MGEIRLEPDVARRKRVKFGLILLVPEHYHCILIHIKYLLSLPSLAALAICIPRKHRLLLQTCSIESGHV